MRFDYSNNDKLVTEKFIESLGWKCAHRHLETNIYNFVKGNIVIGITGLNENGYDIKIKFMGDGDYLYQSTKYVPLTEKNYYKY